MVLVRGCVRPRSQVVCAWDCDMLALRGTRTVYALQVQCSPTNAGHETLAQIP